MTKSVLTLVTILVMSSTVLAADKCKDPQDQSTITACAAERFRASDVQLNELYKKIRLRLKDDSDATELLVKAQHDWVRFRDAECAFQVSGGGSSAAMVETMCAGHLTELRVKELEHYLKCEEGDLSCPVPREN